MSIINYLTQEEYDARIKQCKSLKDVTNLARDLIAPTLQNIMESELEDHLGYKKYDFVGRGSGNSRNGRSEKTLKTSFGPAKLSVPRDRNSSFQPKIVKKYETVDNEIEERIISMYGKGVTTRDIESHMADIYGIDASPAMISMITDKVLPLVSEWQARPLSSLYAFVYLDGMVFKVKDSGRIVNKTAYIVMGINIEGKKEVLGIWIGETEGAKFWMGVLSELKNRGVKDIIIASVDGLTGFPDAIKAVFPDSEVQLCIVHQIRNTLKYVSHKHKKAFASDLRSIYTAPTEDAGLSALEKVKENWPHYILHLRSWEKKWTEIAPFFKYPEEIRHIMYTTNAIESLNRQFRKVTKTTSIFPHEEALGKLLWLAQRDASRKWIYPVKNWGSIISQLAILYPERVRL
jgi:putative transposase